MQKPHAYTTYTHIQHTVISHNILTQMLHKKLFCKKQRMAVHAYHSSSIQKITPPCNNNNPDSPNDRFHKYISTPQKPSSAPQINMVATRVGGNALCNILLLK